MTNEAKRIYENKDGTPQTPIGNAYRRAFLLTLTALIAVVGVASWLFWRSTFNPLMRRSQPIGTASEPPLASTQQTAIENDSAATPSETALAPIQLSPQRMQSIGVKVGTVESKNIKDEIRFYGNVQP